MSSKLVNCAPVFVCPDVKKTAVYYKNILGFKSVEHFDHKEPFAALYRDAVEIIVVQSRFGEVLSNRKRHGAGYDVYLDPEEVEGVDMLYTELKDKGARIVRSPHRTPYATYEFLVEDIDGRIIGIGRIEDKKKFFGEGK